MLTGDKDHNMKPKEQVTAQREGNTNKHLSYATTFPMSRTAPTLYSPSASLRQTHHMPLKLCSIQPYTYRCSSGLPIQLSETLRSRSMAGSSRQTGANWRLCNVQLICAMIRICSKQIASPTTEVSLCSNNIKEAEQLQTSVSVGARPVWVSQTPPGNFLSSQTSFRTPLNVPVRLRTAFSA